jgi:flagellar biosynthesis/type III secretory pathway chaperone
MKGNKIMHMEFDPAMEAIIEDQYNQGVVDLPARVLMLIGKLTYLERQHAKLEVEENILDPQENEYDLQRIAAKKEKLENDIEDLDDDIAYLIYKIQREAKNA